MNGEHNAYAGSDRGCLPRPRPQTREHPHHCRIANVCVEHADQRQPEDDLHCATLRSAITLIVSNMLRGLDLVICCQSSKCSIRYLHGFRFKRRHIGSVLFHIHSPAPMPQNGHLLAGLKRDARLPTTGIGATATILIRAWVFEPLFKNYDLKDVAERSPQWTPHRSIPG